MSLDVPLTSHMPAVVPRAALAGAAYRTFGTIQRDVLGELGDRPAVDVCPAASFHRARSHRVHLCRSDLAADAATSSGAATVHASAAVAASTAADARAAIDVLAAANDRAAADARAAANDRAAVDARAAADARVAADAHAAADARATADAHAAAGARAAAGAHAVAEARVATTARTAVDARAAANAHAAADAHVAADARGAAHLSWGMLPLAGWLSGVLLQAFQPLERAQTPVQEFIQCAREGACTAWSCPSRAVVALTGSRYECTVVV